MVQNVVDMFIDIVPEGFIYSLYLWGYNADEIVEVCQDEDTMLNEVCYMVEDGLDWLNCYELNYMRDTATEYLQRISQI